MWTYQIEISIPDNTKTPSALQSLSETSYESYFTAKTAAQQAITKYAHENHYHVFSRTSRWDIYNGVDYVCTIHVMANANGKKLFPICFRPSQYIESKYNISSGLFGNAVYAEVAFDSVAFARKHENGQFESFLVRDKDVPFDDSLAKKIIDDPMANIVVKTVILRPSDETATDYFLTYQNDDCIIFKPSLLRPVECASNVSTRFLIEFLFAFEDGCVVPIVSEFKTSGCHSVSVSDIYDETLQKLDFDYCEILDLFKTSPNFQKTIEGFNLIASSPERGVTTLEFCQDDRSLRDELRRALVSMRIVDMSETIR